LSQKPIEIENATILHLAIVPVEPAETTSGKEKLWNTAYRDSF